MNIGPRLYRTLLIVFTIALSICSLSACAPSRAILPPGQVPQQDSVASADEQYGQEVLGGLTEQFPLSRNDAQIERVRGIVDKLTQASKSDHNPWHVAILVDDSFKNAAATRGNFIFVWTGMLNAVRSDDELATILAHEIGHVLAGHTAPNPTEEIANIIAGVGGEVASQILQGYGYWGLAAELARVIISETVTAIAVNPSQQQDELEADQIGLFLMADAGYDPQKAVEFWKRIESDPSFESGVPGFLSSHPPIAERFTRLESMLNEASMRYRIANRSDSFTVDATKGDRSNRSPAPVSLPSVSRPTEHRPPAIYDTWSRNDRGPAKSERWVVVESRVNVYKDPSSRDLPITSLKAGTEIAVVSRSGVWLEITEPTRGYLRGPGCAPID